MLKLHDYILSPEAYAVRLALALLGVPHERIAVNAYPGTDQAPIFEDGDVAIEDPGLILTYLARGHGARWLPMDSAPEITRWLVFAALELSALNNARRIATLGAGGDFEASRGKGLLALRTLEDELTLRQIDGFDWLAADRPTIADVAVFPAVALSHDSGIGHEDYPTINLWQRRVRKLPGFIGMPGIPDYF